jgi:FkbM family methyltransferase
MNQELYERVKSLATIREESPEQVMNRFSADQLALIPRSFSKHIPTLRKSKSLFIETGIQDKMAFARTYDGRIFYGYTSRKNHRRAYKFIQDLMPDPITEDTFLVCLDVVQRYATDFTWPPKEILPSKNGTVVECGAYLGYKTIRFAQELVPQGHLLAIEMMPDNVEILRQNIKANNLESRATVVEAGVWKESGEVLVKGKGRQRNTLVDLEKLEEDLGFKARVDKLDHFLAEWGIDPIDLLFITVNGAEIEAIQGLKEWLPKVKGLFIVALYKRDGKSNAMVCKELLQERGCEILASSNANRVIARG